MTWNQCVQVNLCLDENVRGLNNLCNIHPCLSQLLVFTLQLTGDGLVVIQRLKNQHHGGVGHLVEGNGRQWHLLQFPLLVEGCSFPIFQRLGRWIWKEFRIFRSYWKKFSGLLVKILLAQSRIPPQHGKRRLCSPALERSRASSVFGYTSRKDFCLIAKWLVRNSKA